MGDECPTCGAAWDHDDVTDLADGIGGTWADAERIITDGGAPCH